MIAPFAISCPTRVMFGAGAHRDLVSCLPAGIARIALIKGASGTTSVPVQEVLGGHDVTLVTSAGEPTIASVNAVFQQLSGQNINCLIACGGGSVIDTAKALRVALGRDAALSDADFDQRHEARTPLPLIVLPTTAGTGAEVTANAVLGASQAATKVSLRGAALSPSVAVVDPELMRGAPQPVVLHAGLDAFVQNVEAFTSSYATPFSRALSGPAIPSSLTALVKVLKADSLEAWSHLAWCSLSSGMALANGGLGAAHGIASILGGAYGAPHGALCGRLMAPVLRMNTDAAKDRPEIFERLKFCENAITEHFPAASKNDPLSGFEAWLSDQSLPRLGDWGVRAAQIDSLAVASQKASSSQKNAVPLEVAQYAQILQDAI